MTTTKARRGPSAHDRLVDLFRDQAEVIPGQRVSHQELMAAARLLAEASEKERVAGNPYRASEINYLVVATFKAAIRVEDIVPVTDDDGRSERGMTTKRTAARAIPFDEIARDPGGVS